MFHKKYKVKASSALRGSERKKLRNTLESSYPRLTPDDLNNLITSKSEVTQIKSMTASGTPFLIYSLNNTPMFFQVEQQLYPTVYTLWKFPKLLPVIPIVPFAFEKILNGADLMAPGIIVNDATVNEFRNLKLNDVCAIRLDGNMSSVVVGLALQTDLEIISEERKGKAVKVMHCYKDTLWQSGNQAPLPQLLEEKINEFITCDSNLSEDTIINDNSVVPVEDNILLPDMNDLIISESENTELTVNSDVSNCASLDQIKSNEESEKLVCDNETIISKEYSTDDILNQCFMIALKLNGKKIQLPILTSTFYRTYVLTCCPSDLSLDIKKSSYKKLSVFLKAMAKKSLIQVKELSKGVESIVEINFNHESLLDFRSDRKFREHLKIQKEEAIADNLPLCVQENFNFPDVTEMFVVSAQVKGLFEKMKFRKGDALNAKSVRDTVKLYVNENELQCPSDPSMVALDPILTHCLLKSNDIRTSLRWDELFSLVMSRMSPAYEIKFDGDEPKLKKGHIEPIDITTATRTGNKKVTLINNLENFGISPEKLANHVQVAVAASTSVGQASNSKGTQVLIQGNQLRYLQTLLFDIYKVPRKYVRGLENISSKKK